MLKKTLKTMSGVIAAVVFSVSAGTALAEVNFEGETVTIIIPFKEGGGTSRTFRFFQPYLSKYLPGNPVIQLQHMPGAGTIKGGNFFHDNQETDGTFALATSSSVNMQQATGNPLAKFDLLSYEPVLSLATTTHWVTHAELADGPNDISGLQEPPCSRSKPPPRRICSTSGSIKHWVLTVRVQFRVCPVLRGTNPSNVANCRWPHTGQAIS
jgi:hypothetical protein